MDVTPTVLEQEDRQEDEATVQAGDPGTPDTGGDQVAKVKV